MFQDLPLHEKWQALQFIFDSNMSSIHFVIFRANIKRIYNYQANKKGNENKKYLINPNELGKKKKKEDKLVRQIEKKKE